MSENQSPEVETPDAPEGEKRSRMMSFHVLDDGSIRADFVDGVESVELAISDVPEAIKIAAITEGLISRARSYASKLTDNDRTPENLREQTARAFENLKLGVWKIARESSGIVVYPAEVEAAYRFRLARAQAKGEVYSGTLADVAADWEKLTDDSIEEIFETSPDGKKVPTGKTRKVLGQKSQIKALPRYQACYAEVKAERQAAKAAKLAAKADAAEGEDTF